MNLTMLVAFANLAGLVLAFAGAILTVIYGLPSLDVLNEQSYLEMQATEGARRYQGRSKLGLCLIAAGFVLQLPSAASALSSSQATGPMRMADVSALVSICKDILLTIAGAVTATVAWKGLGNWLRELRGRTRFDAAKSLMRAAYALREAVANCRAPLIVAGEFPAEYNEGQPLGRETRRDDKMRAYAHVFAARWSPVSAALTEFETRSLEAEAIWGGDVRPLTRELGDCIVALNAATESFMDDLRNQGENFKADRDFGRKVRSEVFAPRGATDNELTNRITKALEALEKFARPSLR
ncbi:hypothetical protein [Paraburkholderia terrae]|uniref:hypothetical protein n=1 Tax=Paraburkholderia terrae TaxID=311230 RepID=UPI00205280F9|nr:hypothetical protein [Paraburkholderia terrae]BDC45981.1 hypothetical protein PTKU15_92780 [Paraburkholderia terrae]